MDGAPIGRLQDAWRKMYSRVATTPANRRWFRIRGPMSAIITSLLALGWDTPGLFEWRGPVDERWEAPVQDLSSLRAFLASYEPPDLLAAVHKTVEVKLWAG
eukprot:5794228-Pyramimonas_sp.AAC.1